MREALERLVDTLLARQPGRHPPTRRADRPTAATAEARLRRDHHDVRLRVVGDEPVNRELTRMLLDGFGWRVDVAGNGVEAREWLASGRYDLVLMDREVPQMDGLEATRRLRAAPLGLDLPVIAMTAHAFAEDRARCLAAGRNDFIAKPVDPHHLFDTLLAWLDRRPRRPDDGGA